MSSFNHQTSKNRKITNEEEKAFISTSQWWSGLPWTIVNLRSSDEIFDFYPCFTEDKSLSLQRIMIKIDTTNMCSHLQKKLFEEDGVYNPVWKAMQKDGELTAVVRSRQLHIYRNGKKIMVLAGKAAPKIIREDSLSELLPKELLRWKRQSSWVPVVASDTRWHDNLSTKDGLLEGNRMAEPITWARKGDKNNGNQCHGLHKNGGRSLSLLCRTRWWSHRLHHFYSRNKGTWTCSSIQCDEGFAEHLPTGFGTIIAH